MATHVSLFSGIGCDFLGSKPLGFTPVATAENDPWLRKLLNKRFPRALDLGDVRDVDGKNLRALAGGPGSLLSGGFPCQDLSNIGIKRGTGLSGVRSNLYTELMRITGELSPDYVMIENVSVLRSKGLEKLLDALYLLAYDVKWDSIPASALGAPHRRDRVWIGAKKRQDSKVAAERLLAFGKLKPIGLLTLLGHVKGPDGDRVTRFPRAGMMVDGFVYERKDPFPLKRQKGLWPTPRAALNEWRTTRNAPSHGNGHGATLAGMANDAVRAGGGTPAPSSESAGNINPEWVEYLMGLPRYWTDLDKSNREVVPFKGWTTDHYPRTAAGVPNRAHRLKALGNGLVPRVFESALQELINW